MRIVISGATGFIGRSLCLRLRRDGHELVALTRSPDDANGVLEEGIDIVQLRDDDAVIAALDGADAVVNLAGAPIIGKRWSDSYKRTLVASRVDLTRRLVELMGRAARTPKVLVSGSAVGIYGDRGGTVLDESTPAASGFLAKLCVDWEDAALAARDLGVRVTMPRTGVVLGSEGGALEKMIPPFSMGVGGPVGSGDQYVPWIHMDDVLEILAQALVDERYDGPFNLTAPTPCTFRELASALGAAMNRPAAIPVPAFALRAAFGESAQVLLDSQRVVPAQLQAWGYEFAWEHVGPALEHIIRADGAVSIEPVRGALPATDYLARRGATHVLRTEVTLDAPLDEVFDFFSRAPNLGALTPPSLSFEIQPPLPESIEVGTEIRYRIRLGPMPMTWVTRFDVWEAGRRFVDSQLKGPYASWWHEHAFEADGDRTIMRDRVFFRVPFGPLGRIAGALFVRPMLRRIFTFRTHAVAARYGVVDDGADAGDERAAG